MNQQEQAIELIKKAISINASMGKIAEPCNHCFWADRQPECEDTDWHKYDEINTKLHEAIELLKGGLQ